MRPQTFVSLTFIRCTSCISDTKIARVWDTASGMSYLHGKNIIHRDLAARNLLVTFTDNTFTVKVSDFGMSKHMESESYYTSEAKMIPVKWCSLEVVQYGKFSFKGDIWSFGVVMWEIFSYGQIPYATKNNTEVLEMLLKGERMAQPQGCPDKLYDLMKRCWLVEPKERPDFDEILSKLIEYQTPKKKMTISGNDYKLSPPTKAHSYNTLNSSEYQVSDQVVSL